MEQRTKKLYRKNPLALERLIIIFQPFSPKLKPLLETIVSYEDLQLLVLHLQVFVLILKFGDFFLKQIDFGDYIFSK